MLNNSKSRKICPQFYSWYEPSFHSFRVDFGKVKEYDNAVESDKALILTWAGLWIVNAWASLKIVLMLNF